MTSSTTWKPGDLVRIKSLNCGGEVLEELGDGRLRVKVFGVRVSAGSPPGWTVGKRDFGADDLEPRA